MDGAAPMRSLFRMSGDFGQARTQARASGLWRKRRPDSVPSSARTFPRLTDPLPISPASRSLCKANNSANSRLKNESVSTGAALLSIVADHIPSLYLDGAVLRYS